MEWVIRVCIWRCTQLSTSALALVAIQFSEMGPKSNFRHIYVITPCLSVPVLLNFRPKFVLCQAGKICFSPNQKKTFFDPSVNLSTSRGLTVKKPFKSKPSFFRSNQKWEWVSSIWCQQIRKFAKIWRKKWRNSQTNTNPNH